MAAHVWFVLASVLSAVFTVVLSETPHKRFEYKLSFKGPHLVQKDGTVPFWEHGGHAIASDESIRITPSLRSKKGQVWSKNTNEFANWVVEVTFRVSGRGRIGADGLAIWYTAQKGVEGPVFGSNDKWNGLGVFFDSFDNDNQHNNPYILALVNDGTKPYDHDSDGLHQQLGGCLRDFRNKPYPVRAKIEYLNKALTLYYHNGMSNRPEDYELCMRAENVELPANGYFGVSAATGGLADDHDVISFLTHSLHAVGDQKTGTGAQVSEEEQKKYEKEFEEYHEKLQKAKDEYKKEHPDKVAKEDYGEEDKWFESQNERELKQIFDGQNSIHQTVRDIGRKLDEVIGRQERTLSQIALMGQGVQAPPQGGQGGQQQGGQVYVDTIKRHEVDTVLNNQRDLVQHVRDLRSVLNDVHSKTSGLQQGGGYQDQAGTHEVRDAVNSLKDDVRVIMNRPQVEAPKCPPLPPPSNCLTPTYFIFFIVAQFVMMVGYALYRSNKEAAAKKFY